MTDIPPPCADPAGHLAATLPDASREVLLTDLAEYAKQITSGPCASCGDTGVSVTRHCQHPTCPMLVARCECGEVPADGLFDARAR